MSLVYLQGSMRGDLTIRLDQDGASLACFYHQLIPRWDEEQESGEHPPDPNATCTLKVDSQKLWTCLQWQQSSHFVQSCRLCMVENEMLVLHLLLHPHPLGFFTYYIPVQFYREDELLS